MGWPPAPKAVKNTLCQIMKSLKSANEMKLATGNWLLATCSSLPVAGSQQLDLKITKFNKRIKNVY
jgi:hypothetical protein